MSAEIKIEFSQKALDVIRRLQRLPANAAKYMAAAMDQENKDTVAYAQRHRFRGYYEYPRRDSDHALGVGHKHGGQLRSSLHHVPTAIAGDNVASAIGSPVKYFGVHEFGFDGQVQVPAHTRRVKTRDIYHKTKKHKRQIASGVAFVKAHAMRLRMPARQPLYYSILDCLPNYTKSLSKAIIAAAKEEK